MAEEGREGTVAAMHEADMMDDEAFRSARDALITDIVQV